MNWGFRRICRRIRSGSDREWYISANDVLEARRQFFVRWGGRCKDQLEIGLPTQGQQAVECASWDGHVDVPKHIDRATDTLCLASGHFIPEVKQP